MTQMPPRLRALVRWLAACDPRRFLRWLFARENLDSLELPPSSPVDSQGSTGPNGGLLSFLLAAERLELDDQPAEHPNPTITRWLMTGESLDDRAESATDKQATELPATGHSLLRWLIAPEPLASADDVHREENTPADGQSLLRWLCSREQLDQITRAGNPPDPHSRTGT